MPPAPTASTATSAVPASTAVALVPSAQAARLTRVPVAILIAMANRGQIAAVHTDRDSYFHPADLATLRPDSEHALTTAQVARLFDVTPATILNWTTTKNFPSYRTPQGYRRYPRAEVLALLQTTGPAAMDRLRPDSQPALTTAQVARLFDVVPSTVIYWTKAKNFPCYRIPGGHWRYPRAEVLALLKETSSTSAPRT